MRRITGDALYLAWEMAERGGRSSAAVKNRLVEGEEHNLYRLRSWVIVNQEAHALVVPAASLDEIVDELWKGKAHPIETRWVPRGQCANVSREIESVPVRLGLSRRPEQWRYSSASAE